MIEKRITLIKPGEEKSGTIVYWMSRDQRVHDNWSLVYAQELAFKHNSQLSVVFCAIESFLEASIRHFSFMFDGLEEVAKQLIEKNIPFTVLQGSPIEKIPEFLHNIDASILITDFDPLKIKREWKNKISKIINIPFFEVDSHNIVPCHIASNKLEFAAYTIRNKIKSKLDEFLTPYPEISLHPFNSAEFLDKYHKQVFKTEIYGNFPPKVEWIQSGPFAAEKMVKNFIVNKLNNYAQFKNDPQQDALSNLSPYLHFGQISSQKVALEVINSDCNEESKNVFLEELIIRKELSDNFCFYNSNYDSFDGFPDWAKKTLNEHKSDKRFIQYTTEEFELSKTHDELWNAAQTEMLITGKMHGYMRMYWAKKILEWSDSPESAMKTAIYLNDKYELDGRDPNGYTGIAWSIGGVHDRAWFDRPIFGKIRYMNYNGMTRKFNVKQYISIINHKYNIFKTKYHLQ